MWNVHTSVTCKAHIILLEQLSNVSFHYLNYTGQAQAQMQPQFVSQEYIQETVMLWNEQVER